MVGAVVVVVGDRVGGGTGTYRVGWGWWRWPISLYFGPGALTITDSSQ